LRSLYDKYHASGFELLAFPVNQFGCQAPETSEGERQAAIRKFGFDFPVFDKVAAKYKPAPECSRVLPVIFPMEGEGTDADEVAESQPVDDTAGAPMSEVYRFLKNSEAGGSTELEWNYVKFLVGRDGSVLKRYKPGDPLAQGMEDDIKAALDGKPLPVRTGSPLGL